MFTDICVMHILLAAATTLEIQPTTGFLEKKGFRLGNHELGILTTGVGALATVHSLMRQVLAHRPDLVIQAGIAGCFPENRIGKMVMPGKVTPGKVTPGKLVAVREEALDLGVWEEGRFRTLFDLRLAEPDRFPFSGGLLVNPYRKLLDLTGFEQVSALSVNEITTDPKRIEWHQQNGSPVVESMEGGALHYTCLLEGIPFLQIRSVSNEVGVRDKTKWDIPAAVNRLNEELTGLLNKLAGLDESILQRLATLK